MDRTDEKIIDLLKGNARMSFQELGDELGMSRVAAKKRVKKLEEAGIIRGYNTCIYRDEDITMLIDIVVHPWKIDEVITYISTRTAFVRQIFRTGYNRIHMVAVSSSMENLEYLVRMIKKKCGDDIEDLSYHTVEEVIKDVYGGIKVKRDQGQTVMEIMKQARGFVKVPGKMFQFRMYMTQDMMDATLDALDLSVRSYNCLKRAGFNTVGELFNAISGTEDLKKLRNCGTKSTREIMEHLFVFQYYSLAPDKRAAYLQEVEELNR